MINAFYTLFGSCDALWANIVLFCLAFFFIIGIIFLHTLGPLAFTMLGGLNIILPGFDEPIMHNVNYVIRASLLSLPA